MNVSFLFLPTLMHRALLPLRSLPPRSVRILHTVSLEGCLVMDISFRYSHFHNKRYRTDTPTTGCFICSATRKLS